MEPSVVILAGGSGTRLWPASRAGSPKQFLSFDGGPSLFQRTLERALALGPAGAVLVVGHRDHRGEVRRQWRAVTRSPLLLLPEPAARNTAPAIAFAAAALRAAGEGERPMLVLAADHLISPVERFAADAASACALAEKGRLVTFGIPPRYPETGYGYIEAGGPLDGGFAVRRFREKPDLETARGFLEAGGFYWNSGMFAFRPDVFLAELERCTPEAARPFLGLTLDLPPRRSGRLAEAAGGEALEAVYRRVPAVSVDYALMEKSDRVAMVSASFEWSDVGSWDEAGRIFGGRSEGVVQVDAADNEVFSDLPVALAGVSGLIVVVRGGAVLVCRRGESQKVKAVVERLKEQGREDLL